jgi:hypothetical protein
VTQISFYADAESPNVVWITDGVGPAGARKYSDMDDHGSGVVCVDETVAADHLADRAALSYPTTKAFTASAEPTQDEGTLVTPPTNAQAALINRQCADTAGTGDRAARIESCVDAIRTPSRSMTSPTDGSSMLAKDSR